jgi:hypothetical protein
MSADTIFNPRAAALARAALGKCDGQCAEHVGDVRVYSVSFGSYEYGYFSYCDRAVKDDERTGLRVMSADDEDAES